MEGEAGEGGREGGLPYTANTYTHAKERREGANTKNTPPPSQKSLFLSFYSDQFDEGKKPSQPCKRRSLCVYEPIVACCARVHEAWGKGLRTTIGIKTSFLGGGFACDEGRVIGTIGNLASVKTKLTKGISS